MLNLLSDKNAVTGNAKDFLLPSLLENSKKHRIKAIAERYGIRLSDKSTKQQMIDVLLPAIEAGFGIRLKQYSQEELRLAMQCFNGGEVSTDSDLAEKIVRSAPFCDGAIYLISKKDMLFTAVPHELAGRLMAHCVTRCFDEDGGELALCASACAAIYGRFTAKQLAEVANNAYSLGITERQADEYLQSADRTLFTYGDSTAVSNRRTSWEIHPEADGMDDYLPTRREIQAYATYGADSNEYYYRQIIQFLYNNAELSYDAAAGMMRRIAQWCTSDEDFKPVFDMIQQSDLRLSVDQFNYLIGMIGELNVRTCKPHFKGHKNTDIPNAKPLVIPGVQVAYEKTQPVRVAQKIGRNDPCPCGSGKKYKKCCGKNGSSQD